MKTVLLAASAAVICLGVSAAHAGSYGVSVGYHSGPAVVHASYGHGYRSHGSSCYVPPPPVCRTAYYYPQRRHYSGHRHHYRLRVRHHYRHRYRH